MKVQSSPIPTAVTEIHFKKRLFFRGWNINLLVFLTTWIPSQLRRQQHNKIHWTTIMWVKINNVYCSIALHTPSFSPTLQQIMFIKSSFKQINTCRKPQSAERWSKYLWPQSKGKERVAVKLKASLSSRSRTISKILPSTLTCFWSDEIENKLENLLCEGSHVSLPTSVDVVQGTERNWTVWSRRLSVPLWVKQSDVKGPFY